MAERSSTMNLAGNWQYEADPTGVMTETAAREKLGDTCGRTMAVPSNWSRQTEDLKHFNGVVWFARKFTVAAAPSGRRRHLFFGGVDYACEIFLNGVKVGEHTGYFEPFRLDVTDALRAGENILLVRVDAPRDAGYANEKTLIKGILVHHDCRPGSRPGQADQNQPTGGIWGAVRLEETGPVALDAVLIDSTVGEKSARVRVRCRLRNLTREKKKAQVGVSIGGETFPLVPIPAAGFVDLDPGASAEVTLDVDVAEPRLWWTWDHGTPDLYNALVMARVDGATSDTVTEIFGIRTIEFDESTLCMKLNGRRIFHKGSNYIATQWLAEFSEEKYRQDIALMKESNLNSIRVHAHILPRVFTDLCDRAGVLVWADFPMIWGYANTPEFAAEAMRQYEIFIEKWYNHPSIWIWSAHNEGSANDELNIRLAAHGLALDPTRVQLKNSGKWPPGPGGWDDHAYDGWYAEEYTLFASRRHGFVTEYGAQAVPSRAHEFLADGRRWPPDLEDWRYHNFQVAETTRNLGMLELYRDLDEFTEISQKYQYDLVRFATEAHRRTKWKPCCGIYHFMFTECWPSITWAVVDHRRERKLGFAALRDSMAPVIVSLETHKRFVSPGERIDVPVWIVSDLLEPLRGWSVRFGVVDGDIREAAVDVPADGAVSVAVMAVTAPIEPGEIRLMAVLRDAAGRVVSETEWSFLVQGPAQAGRDLSGAQWRFSPGDDLARAQPEFDDGAWARVAVPENLELTGVRSGYGWYRLRFTGGVPGGPGAIFIGGVYEVDETYLNGRSLGRTGEFPPLIGGGATTGTPRWYAIPEGVLRDGENVLSIRVWSAGNRLGIGPGKVKLLPMDESLKYRPVRRRYS